MNCDHVECRCARADELAAMGQTFEAVQLHRDAAPVRCRKWWNIPDVYSAGGLSPYAVVAYREGLTLAVEYCRNDEEARDAAQSHAIPGRGNRRVAIVHAVYPYAELVAEVVCP